MSEDILIDYVLEVYAPAEGNNRERLQTSIHALIIANAEGRGVIDPE